LGGYDPYSSSKGCAEIVTSAYRNSFFNPTTYADHRVAVASARAGNVIGGGDWATDRLIPDILRTLITGQPLEIRNPLAVRPWQHVLEPLNGYLTLAERLCEVGPKFCGGWNFGPHESGVKPVSWVADQLLSLWGEGVSWKQDASYQPHEDNFLILDCSKARHRLGWSPTLDLRAALSWIVSWVRAYQAGYDMRRVTEGQISEFTRLLSAEESQSKVDQQTKRAFTWQEHAHLFDLVHETIMSRSVDGTIGFWNRGAEEMYGWKKEEAIGRVSHLLLKTEFPQPLEEIEAELGRTGQWEGKLIHKRRDGQRIAVKSRWAMQPDGERSGSSVLEINHGFVAKSAHKLSLLMYGAFYFLYNAMEICTA
jgi:PAS domain S-box-containing protein